MLTSKSSFVLTLLSFLLILRAVYSQVEEFDIISSPILIDGQNVSIPVCFADCSSCQTNNGHCETCFEPWFQIIGGTCQIAIDEDKKPKYILESTKQEKRSENFIPSTSWIYQSTTLEAVECAADTTNFNKKFSIAGFLGSNNVTYRRTISQHDYIAVRLLVLLFNWQQSAELNITITNEDSSLMGQKIIQGSSENIKRADEKAQCNGKKYKKISLKLEMYEANSRQIIITIIPKLSQNSKSQWSFSSFILVSGKCNSNCQTCTNFSPDLRFCGICTGFRDNKQQSRCSICNQGFQPLMIEGKQNGCRKCDILYKNCKQTKTCNYPQLTSISDNCTLEKKDNYSDEKFIPSNTDLTFFSSLFRIGNVGSSITNCGSHSIVGPAAFGEIISRTFLTLPPHVKLSINLNIFIFDQEREGERYNLVILLDDKPVSLDSQLQNVNITGFSNECGNPTKFQAMKSFETEKFIQHKNSDRVKIGVSIGSARGGTWGIRDIRLVYLLCDQFCVKCSENGCIECKGLLQLKDGICSECPGSSGRNQQDQKFCTPCIKNCVSCNITGTVNFCLKCMDGFYLFTNFDGVQSCQKFPNYADEIKEGEKIDGTVIDESDCKVIKGKNKQQQLTLFQFEVGENKLVKKYTLPNHYKYKIQFMLIKIDDWEGDELIIYLNDLIVNRTNLKNTGSQVCGIKDQNQELFLYQFTLTDDTETVTVEFEVVQKDKSKKRRFGIGDLKIFPIGCPQCENFQFFYRLQYNTDQYLSVEVSFNIKYENNDPQDFKNTFQMMIDNQEVKYDIISNDSVRYWLRVKDTNDEIINKDIVLLCKYPARVKGVVDKEDFQTYFSERFLTQDDDYANTKYLDNDTANIGVERFTPPDQGQKNAAQGLATFFEVLTRAVVYLGFASFFIGCQTPFTHLMHNFQKIWVHIYIASLTMSSILKMSLTGFRECQDQNIAINPDGWEGGIPDPLFYDAPAQYQIYYQDINFFRNIYNVGVAFTILGILFIILHLVFRSQNSEKLREDKQKCYSILMRHLRITFSHRPMFYFNSIIFYQYFTVCLAWCLQLIDPFDNSASPTQNQAFRIMNIIACVIALIFTLLYPLIFSYYILKKRSKTYEIIREYFLLSKDLNPDNIEVKNSKDDITYANTIFNNKYSQVFYRFLPSRLWEQERPSIIREKETLYNCIRFGELFWFAIVVCFLHRDTFSQSFLLIITQLAHIILIIVFNRGTTAIFNYLKIFEMISFIGLEFILLFMSSFSQSLRSETIEILGNIGVLVIFLIITLSVMRTIYTCFKIYTEYLPTGKDSLFNYVRRYPRGFDEKWLQTNDNSIDDN